MQSAGKELSFSARVKEELAEHSLRARHCQLAELAAILSAVGEISMDPYRIEVFAENPIIIQTVSNLLKSCFHTEPTEALDAIILDDSIAADRKSHTSVKTILRELGFLTGAAESKHLDPFMPDRLLTRSCCQKAYIQGAFLSSGSINDPTKNYHVEILFDEKRGAERLQSFLKAYGIESRILTRTRKSVRYGEDQARRVGKSVYVLYLKDGEQIVDVLAVMKAQKALMELENVRIVKDMRNMVNRQVNCETANLNRIVNTSVKQIADIRYLKERGVLSTLSPELQQMAEVRLENENIPLKDLGKLMDPPVSKSGTYHRLKKLSEIAESLRGENKGEQHG